MIFIPRSDELAPIEHRRPARSKVNVVEKAHPWNRSEPSFGFRIGPIHIESTKESLVYDEADLMTKDGIP